MKLQLVLEKKPELLQCLRVSTATKEDINTFKGDLDVVSVGKYEGYKIEYLVKTRGGQLLGLSSPHYARQFREIGEEIL